MDMDKFLRWKPKVLIIPCGLVKGNAENTLSQRDFRKRKKINKSNTIENTPGRVMEVEKTCTHIYI